MTVTMTAATVMTVTMTAVTVMTVTMTAVTVTMTAVVHDSDNTSCDSDNIQ